MRVCIDARPALRQGTGVGTYVRGLITALADAFPDDRYVALFASLRDRPGNGWTPEGALEVVDRRLPVRLLDRLWHRWRWPPVERLVGDLDVAHSPSPMLLPARAARQVITVHDCWFLRRPEDAYGPMRRDYVPLARAAVDRADAVLVPSVTTRREAVELLGAAAERVHVTPLGVDPLYLAEPPGGAAATEALLRRLGVDRPYLLFVGRREPRKDLGTLLDAMRLVFDRRPEVGLVLAGPSGPGWDRVWERAAAPVQQRCLLLPHQPPERLAHLYGAAEALVVSSRWEGFGLPPLEALARSTPVVATRAGALPEILDEAAVWAEPGDAEGLAAACLELLADPDLARRGVSRGRELLRRYRWERTAQLTRSVYEGIVGR